MAEKQDVFSQSVEIGDGEDPFAGSDFGDWSQEPDSEPDTPADTTDLPVVNREGERVDDQLARPEPAPQPQSSADAPAPPSPPEEPQAAEVPPAPAPAPAEPQAVPEPPQDPIAVDPAPERDETRVLTPDDLDEAGYDGPVAPADTDLPVTHPAHPVNHPQPPVPEPPKPQPAVRAYIVLKVEGPGQFSQVSWFEDANGNMVPHQNVPGAKRQTVVRARTRADALRVGYIAVGSPPDGVTLIPVAAGNFQPRKVRPKPPEPSKTRLEIS